LNKGAASAVQEVGVSAATDVTGFGFLGHLSEMLEASGVGAVVQRGKVPVWERAVPLAAKGCYPGGLSGNWEYLETSVSADGVGTEDLLPLFDPQTSGGLLISVPADLSGELVGTLERHETSGAIVGEVIAASGIRVTP
jgi:selenide,water dikinase